MNLFYNINLMIFSLRGTKETTNILPLAEC